MDASTSRPDARATSICAWSALMKTSTRAPAATCLASTFEPPALTVTPAPPAVTHARPASAITSARLEAALTVSGCAAAATGASAASRHAAIRARTRPSVGLFCKSGRF